MRAKCGRVPGPIDTLPRITACVLRGEDINIKERRVPRFLRSTVLSDIYLVSMYRKVEFSLDKHVLLTVIHYVDYYLLLFNRTELHEEYLALATTPCVPQEKAGNLVFMSGVPSQGGYSFKTYALSLRNKMFVLSIFPQVCKKPFTVWVVPSKATETRLCVILSAFAPMSCHHLLEIA